MSRGRPPFQPTAEMREQCEILAAGRMSEEDIAAAIGISRPTLKKHFAHELTAGAAQRTAAVLRSMFEAALAGNVAAQKAWLARQADRQVAAEMPGKKAQRDADAAGPPPDDWGVLLPH